MCVCVYTLYIHQNKKFLVVKGVKVQKGKKEKSGVELVGSRVANKSI